MKYIAVKSVVSMAVFASMSSIFSAVCAAAPNPQPEVQLLTGDHGWASCRYQAFIELQPGVRSRLSITAQRDGYGPSGVRLETPGDAKPGSVQTVRLLVPDSSALLDIQLAAQGARYHELPRGVVMTILDALAQRSDLILEVSDGAVWAKISATPGFRDKAESRRQFQSCVKSIGEATSERLSGHLIFPFHFSVQL